MILEIDTDPGDEISIALANKTRLDTAYNLCLVNKTVSGWIEPLLYKMVLLESDRDIMAFGYALEEKREGFLSRHVRALWILESQSSAGDGVFDFQQLYSTLENLEHLALPRNWFRTLKQIPSPSKIRHLTLIKPNHHFDKLVLFQVELQSLHVIDPHLWIMVPSVAGSQVRSRQRIKKVRSHIEKIPRMCFEFTKAPAFIPTDLLFATAIDLKSSKMLHQGSDPVNSKPGMNSDSKPRSIWFKGPPAFQLEFATEIAQHYEELGPSNRKISLENPFSSSDQCKQFTKLPSIRRIKEAIRYNELHWDRVAHECATRGPLENNAEKLVDES